MAEALDLDIDTLLAREDFIGVLTREYGFSDENLEKFAELLFDFAAASPDRDATVRLACGITAIYRYLTKRRLRFPEPLLHLERIGRLLVTNAP